VGNSQTPCRGVKRSICASITLLVEAKKDPGLPAGNESPFLKIASSLNLVMKSVKSIGPKMPLRSWIIPDAQTSSICEHLLTVLW